MKIKKSHIFFSLLIIGIFSLTSVGMDSFSIPSYFVEIEIEESISDINNLDFEKEKSESKIGNGGNSAILFENPHGIALFFSKTHSLNAVSEDLSLKSPLFILYCCLKLDC